LEDDMGRKRNDPFKRELLVKRIKVGEGDIPLMRGEKLIVQTSPHHLSNLDLYIGFIFTFAVALFVILFLLNHNNPSLHEDWSFFLIVTAMLMVPTLGLTLKSVYRFPAILATTHFISIFFSYMFLTNFMMLLKAEIFRRYSPPETMQLPQEMASSFVAPWLSIMFIAVTIIIAVLISMVKSEVPKSYKGPLAISAAITLIISFAAIVAPDCILFDSELGNMSLFIFGALLVMYAILLMIFLLVHEYEMVLTNKRVLIVQGFMGREVKGITYDQIRSIRVHQGMLGKIYDFGDVVILTSKKRAWRTSCT